MMDCLCHALLHNSMPCGLLASEFCDQLVIQNKLSQYVDCVVYGCHALLCISPYCELLVGEFSEFSYFESSPHVLLILWIFFAMLCCSFQRTVDCQSVSSKKFQFHVKSSCLVYFLVCLCHFLFLISMHCGLLQKASLVNFYV